MKRLTVLLTLAICLWANDLFALDSLKINSVGMLWRSGMSHAVAGLGETVFIGTDEHLEAYNLADWQSPRMLGRVSVSGIKAIALQGRMRAAVALGGDGLALVAIDPPNQMRVTARLRDDVVNDVHFHNQKLVVGTESGSVIFYSLVNPANPNEYSRLSRLSAVRKIIDRGDYFIVATQNGLVVVDVTDEANPAFVSRVDVRGNHTDLEIVGDIAFMVDAPDTIRRIDISSLENPRLLGSYPTWFPTDKVFANGRYLYLPVSDGEGIGVIDWWDEDTPESLKFVANDFGALNIDTVGSELVALGRGFTRLNVEDPSTPGFRDHIGFSGIIANLKVMSDQAVGAFRNNGVGWFDLTDPAKVKCTGLSFESFSTNGVHPVLSGENADQMFLMGENSISVLDKTNEGINRTLFYEDDEVEEFRNLEILNGRMMLSTGFNGLKIIGFDPERPQHGPLTLESRNFEHAVEAAYPLEDSSYYVLLTNAARNTTYFQRSDMREPQRLRDYENNAFFKCIHDGDWYYLGGNEMTRCRITRNSMTAYHYNFGFANLTDFSVSGDFIALLVGGDSLYIYDVIGKFENTWPYALGYLKLDAEYSGVGLTDSLLFVYGDQGLRVMNCWEALKVQQEKINVPEAFSFAVFPNPFNGSARIELKGSGKSPIKAWVFDATGRRVFGIIPDEIYGAGDRTIPIEMQNQPAGSYFLKIGDSRKEEVKVINLIR